eukprot:GHUV01029539.1.p2 GENE.GHUV01029539.1~~GHUV01029539.1.p2  ORF type:complete len:116 (-),score=22.89 GHUV01029539.1:270-617(-)
MKCAFGCMLYWVLNLLYRVYIHTSPSCQQIQPFTLDISACPRITPQEFLLDEGRLRKRLVAAAAVNLVLSPFLLMFLVIYFFMKHAERFYHSPGMCMQIVRELNDVNAWWGVWGV